MFVRLVIAALVAVVVSAQDPASPPHAAEAPAPAASAPVGWGTLLGCVWEDDAVGCLREHSARALKEISAAKKAEAAPVPEEKEQSILEVLHDGTARMIEYLSKDEEETPAVEENKTEGEGQEQGRGMEEGRKKIKIGKLGKKGKKGGGLLHTFYMLKMMLSTLISVKLSVLSFILQVKTFFISLIFVTIQLVQFFWRLQEKKQHGGFVSAGPAAWDQGSSFGGYGPSAQSGGWDKRAWSEQAHRQAFAAQAPAS